MLYILTVNCPVGTYFFNNTCTPCPLGWYNPKEAQSQCISCPMERTTAGEGAINSSDCYGISFILKYIN